MSQKFTCRLDGEAGNIMGLLKNDFIFSVNRGDSVQFEIEGGSRFGNAKTELLVSENTNPPVVYKGTLVSNHWTCTVLFQTAGSIQLSLCNSSFSTAPDYIIVNPSLFLGNDQIPLESISFQTVLSRSLGPIDNWLNIFYDQHQLGYNFFHITPVQVLGGSHSLYCIKDPTELNPILFPGLSPAQRLVRLEDTLKTLDNSGIGCIVDIVLNHCAFDSEFVEEFPECTYNLTNSPYHTAAYCLDKALHDFSINISQKNIRNLHNKNKIETEKDLSTIMQILKLEVLPPLALHQYFQMDVPSILKKFEENFEEIEEISEKNLADLKGKGLEYFIRVHCLENEGEAKYSVSLKNKLVWKACKVIGHTRENSIKEVKKALPVINSYLLSRFDKHFAEILSNIEGDIRYHKLELCKGEITRNNPLVRRYFQELRNGHIVLHNGFIMGNKEVLKDFAGKENWHYFRRNVVIWADCIKLRYGESYQDCSPLWEKMAEYIRTMAKIFKGLRLDNAHGTPLQVSAYMLNEARKVNPNLYVMAELFTSESKLDAYFVKYLGFSGLVREAINSSDPKQQGSHVYEYGCGESSSLGKLEDTYLKNLSLFGFSKLERLKPKAVPAIFYDCTHDNPTPYERRKPHDAMSASAMLAMTNCTIASTRGYDEFLIKNLSVVSEKRVYSNYPITQINKINPSGEITVQITFSHEISQKVNTVDVKGEWDNWTDFFPLQRTSECNFLLHLGLSKNFLGRTLSYKFVLDQKNWVHDWKQPYQKSGGNINNVLKVADSAFCNIATGIYPTMRPAREFLNKLHSLMSIENYSEIYVHQCTNDVHMIIRQNPINASSYVMVTRSAFWDDPNPVSQYGLKLPGIMTEILFISVLSFPNKNFVEDPNFVKGLKGNLLVLSNFQEFGNIVREGNVDVMNLEKIPQGFVCILKTELINKDQIVELTRIYQEVENNYQGLLSGISLEGMNHLLWRCGNEELDVSGGQRDLYKVDGCKGINYAGIGGIAFEFLNLLGKNSLGHEICNNMRAGDWLIDYLHSRLIGYVPGKVSDYISKALSLIKNLPRGIIPKHFVKFVLTLFEACKRYQIEVLFGIEVKSRLEEWLYTAVSQFWADVPSASSSLYMASMSAGLPHFSTGFMRVWGRDTFIAFKGLLICTHRWEEAKSTLLTFAAVVRHGLIPNLLDSGKNSRYNARDATWFFMHAVRTYVEAAPNGAEILKERVKMIYKSDSQEEHHRNPHDIFQSFSEILQNIMQSHASGINFREWNAGSRIDSHMRDEGFNIKIKLSQKNGFIYGGNRWNCGTWMDKMGSSSKASNSGVPATPRDGAPIELTGLLFSTLKFLVSQYDLANFPHSGVILEGGARLEYCEWLAKIQENFEKNYFVPIEKDRISGYYKDNLGSSVSGSDFQVRPNMCIAMAVAPELFDRNNVLSALDVVQKELMPGLGTSQIGIKTLNDGDNAYRGFYENSNDSSDYYIAHGYSYHNGPEWVWPVGYYLQSVLEFMHDKELVMKSLKLHLDFIQKSDWMSLPELTNKFGEICTFSCPAQAWSISTLIEVVQKLDS